MIKNKQFFTLFFSQSISNIGEQIYILALPWFVYELTHSTLTMGTVAAMISLPQILFGFFLGSIIDNGSKKKLLFISTLIQVLLCGIIPTLYYFEVLEIYHIYVISFLYSTSSLLFLSTYRSTIPNIVRESELLISNSWIQSSLTIIKIIGPIIGGFLLAYYNATFAMLVNMFSFFFLLIFIPTLKINQESIKKSNKQWSIIKDSLDGIKFIFHDKNIFQINIISLFLNFSIYFSTSMILYFLLDERSLNSTEVGYLYALGGGIAFLITLMAKKINKNFNLFQSIFISCAFTGIAFIFFPIPTHWILFSILFGFINGGLTLASIFINTYLQKNTPSFMLGRVFTTSQMLSRVTAPVAVFLSGWLIENKIISISSVFTISGIGIILVLLTNYLFFEKIITYKKRGIS